MKHFFIIYFLFLSDVASGQGDWTKYEHIQHAQDKTITGLAEKICEPYSTPREKVEAIYYWVAHNISYDYKLLKKIEKEERKKKKKKYGKEELKKNKIKDINKTLKTKRGVCQQYAELFSALCEVHGIQAETIGGWVKANPLKSSGVGAKHAWNAVYLEGNWYLLDVTFASGYLNAENEFHFSFSPEFLYVDPSAFQINHHPRLDRWQLAKRTIAKEEYKSNAVVGAGFIKHSLQGLSPSESKLLATKGEVLEVKFNSASDIKELFAINLRNEKPLEVQAVRTGDTYKISIDTQEMKSGVYGFFDIDEKLLFSYKISLN